MDQEIAWESYDDPPFKYRLTETYTLATSIYPPGLIVTTHVTLHMNGNIVLREGWQWDGASSVGIDTPNFMRPSCVHDAFYYLMREGYLPKTYRKQADQLMYRLCREDGMAWLRAKYCYWAVRLFGWNGLKKRGTANEAAHRMREEDP